MKTKVTVVGKVEATKPKLKPIELLYLWNTVEIITKSSGVIASRWDNIELISTNYRGTGFDLMFAYDEGYRDGDKRNCLYLGHFNDGVV